jgi:hypothetical protein
VWVVDRVRAGSVWEKLFIVDNMASTKDFCAVHGAPLFWAPGCNSEATLLFDWSTAQLQFWAEIWSDFYFFSLFFKKSEDDCAAVIIKHEHPAIVTARPAVTQQLLLVPLKLRRFILFC